MLFARKTQAGQPASVPVSRWYTRFYETAGRCGFRDAWERAPLLLFSKRIRIRWGFVKTWQASFYESPARCRFGGAAALEREAGRQAQHRIRLTCPIKRTCIIYGFKTSCCSLVQSRRTQPPPGSRTCRHSPSSSFVNVCECSMISCCYAFPRIKRIL